MGDCSEDAVPWLQLVQSGFTKKLDESSDLCYNNVNEEDEEVKYEPANILTMLEYKRPEGSRSQKKFCNRFLRPTFGLPDAHGNYTHIVGDKPKVAFMAHHDTVHKTDGKQKLTTIVDCVVNEDGKECLGADCTTGVYIILKMIEAGVEGVYVVHAGEEIGCIGSSKLVKDHPAWIDHVEAAISFDRKGYSSIITHQMGYRTCSEAFSTSLAGILDMDFTSDSGGVYTDSNEYVDLISECTNLSVGYFNQHTGKEYQDLAFLNHLVTSLIAADWSKLVFARDPSVVEMEAAGWGNWPKAKYPKPAYSNQSWSDLYGDSELMDNYSSGHDPYEIPRGDRDDDDVEDLMEVMRRHPRLVARLFQSIGYNASGLIDDISDLSFEKA